MPSIFDFLYREFCRARLSEMRRQLLVARREEVREAAWVRCTLDRSLAARLSTGVFAQHPDLAS